MRQWFLIAMVCVGLSGCAVVAVADAVVATGVTVVKAGVKTVGAVVDAVIPDKKPDPAKEKDKK